MPSISGAAVEFSRGCQEYQGCLYLHQTKLEYKDYLHLHQAKLPDAQENVLHCMHMHGLMVTW